MPNFESPIGKRNFSGPAMREFDVPDESDYPPQRGNIDERSIRNFQERVDRQFGFSDEEELARAEQEIRIAREAKKNNKEKLNEGAKRRIEILIGLTQTVREIDINGNIFILRTLKSKEMKDAIMAASEFDGTVQGIYEIRRQLLAKSLTHVAGVDIDNFLGSTSFESKLSFIDELDDAFSSRLYDEYVTLSKESKEKYSIKSDQEMKEVIEDLKKS